MSSEPRDSPGFHIASPQVVLNRIGEIHTFEIMDNELDDIDQIVAAENQALGFACGAIGVFASTLPSWATAANLSVTGALIYAVMTFGSGVVGLWSALTWKRERKRRSDLRSRIRARSRLALGAPAVPTP